MDMEEFRTWNAYRKKYGPMTPVRRYDAGPAIVASMVSRLAGGSATPKDFMPYGKESERAGSLEDYMTAFARAGVKIVKRG